MVKCQECGCDCNRCLANDHDVHLHIEIENLKQKLVERESHIVEMETNFLNEANKFPRGELAALGEELLTWQDKYKRLYDAHRRVQRVNQGLEDKLLKLVDVCETEKSILTKDVAVLSQKLADANYSIKKLTLDNERYKNDVSLAIQFLQCKQSNFVAHRFESLPQEVQMQVSSHMTNKRKPEEKKPSYEMKSIKVPIPTFPPTAMVYSVPKSPKEEERQKSEPESPVDIVSAAIMAKVLEERQKEKAYAKHCDTCTCSKKLNLVYEITHHSTSTQTGDYKNCLCLKCNEFISQNSQIRIVKHETSAKKVQPSAGDLVDGAQSGNNVVKVQPNNFLIDDSNTVIVQPNNSFFRAKDASPKLGVKIEHLCANNSSSGNKGPKYSMSLRTHSSNILLDSAQESVSSVLYKRQSNNIQEEEASAANESDSSISISVTSDLIQNQMRVADWVQNNLDNELSSSDSVCTDKGNVDRVQYAKMEENVKRFLFGESEFLKTVEKGKHKYQKHRHNNGNDLPDTPSTRSGALTETEI